MIKSQLKSKLLSRQAVIGVIGLGYVGLPLVRRFAQQGFKVLGFDTDSRKVEALNAGRSYIRHIPDEDLAALRRPTPEPAFSATSDMACLGEPDALLICVPTPLDRHREPDLQYLEKTARDIGQTLRPGQLVSLESTTYPGTTEEVVLPILAQSGFQVGRDYFLVFSPEREDPGNSSFALADIPKVVGGISSHCLQVGETLYSQIIKDVVPVSSTRVAEMTKLLENIYRAVNIALVNELKVLCLRMNIDIHEVINAAKTKPFGFQAFYPGPGLGGHCIPIDPFYLSWKSREYDFHTRFIELAGEINTYMPYFVVERTIQALNDQGQSIKGARVLIMGLAYKKDIDDVRESASLKIMDLLLQRGARVDYHDPYIPVVPATRRYQFNFRSVPFSPESVGNYDVVLIATDHSCIDYGSLANYARLIVDTRNAIPGYPYPGKVVKA